MVLWQTLRDTAGQEEYATLRPLAYTNADIFLITFSAENRESMLNAIKKVQSFIYQVVPWSQESHSRCSPVVYLQQNRSQKLNRHQHDLHSWSQDGSRTSQSHLLWVQRLDKARCEVSLREIDQGSPQIERALLWIKSRKRGWVLPWMPNDLIYCRHTIK